MGKGQGSLWRFIMKVAFATTDGKSVDEHFGRAGMFAIYDIMETGHLFVEMRTFADGMDMAVVDTKDMGALHDDAVQNKVDRLADCKLIYLTEIGGPSAARLVKKGIMPMKVRETIPIEEALKQLSATISKSPPPCFRNAMQN